jgi:hypothetical protein
MNEMENLEEKVALLETAVLDERKRLSSDRLDISFGELINLYKNGELIIRPQYQRLFRWSEAQKTALIESILLSIPIPPIFVAEDKDGVWELVDGLQRVSTFISFFGDLKSNGHQIDCQVQSNSLITNEEEDIDEYDDEGTDVTETKNKWILQEGGLVKALQGFNVDTLPGNLKINLKRAVCRVEILRGESSTSMKYELFKRLNSGGSKLTPQELLLKIANNELFRHLTALSTGRLDELYDQELVLRFFAFYNNAENIDDNMERYLNSFMEETVKNPDFDYEGYEALLMRVLELVGSANDERIFRNHRGFFVPAYFEGILIGVAQNIDKYTNNIDLLKAKITELKSDTEFRRFSGSASNSRSRIRNRLQRINQIFR